MRIAYADPPYPGCAHLYREHPDFAGEVDHAELLERLRDFDGWVLHTSAPALRDLLPLTPPHVRVMPWVRSGGVGAVMLAAHLQAKRDRERVVVLEAILRLAVDLIPPCALDTPEGAHLIAAIERARVPAVRT